MGILPDISHIGIYIYIYIGSAPKGLGVGFFGTVNENTLSPFWSGIGYGFRENYGSV